MLLWFLLFQSSKLPTSFSHGTGDDRPDRREKDETFEDQASRKRRGGSGQLELFTNQLDWNPLRGKNLQWDPNSTFVIWRLILLSVFLHFLHVVLHVVTVQLTILTTSLMLWLSGSLDREEDKAKEWEHWALHRTLQVSSISPISQVSSNLSSDRVRSTHQWVQQSATAYFLANV